MKCNLQFCHFLFLACWKNTNLKNILSDSDEWNESSKFGDIGTCSPLDKAILEMQEYT